MKKLIVFLFALLPSLVLAAGGSSVPLGDAKVDLDDQASMQRGAKYFANYCMGCHSAKFARYNRVARDLGIPEDVMEENLIFAETKIGNHMKIAMRPEDSKKWFGATPPDLTLVARVRGADWLYTYLNSFYADETRPYGVNNVVFKDVGMPHVLEGLQGTQVKGSAPVVVGFDPLTGRELTEVQEDVLYLAEAGTMNEQEFDTMTRDLTNFLVYMGEPIAIDVRRSVTGCCCS